MWGVTLWEKVFIKNESGDLSDLGRSAMLYGNEAWCLKENEMAVLRKTKKAMMRAMCVVS